MKIVTKHYGNTIENDKKYLVYLMDSNNQPLSCSDVIGEKAKSLAESELHNKYGDDITTVESHDLNRFIDENNLSITKNGDPLVLVFYLDRELMKQVEIIEPFSTAINDMLAKKDANAIALFIPTDNNERVECINPKVISDETQEKVNLLINDITKNFDIGTNEDDIVVTTVTDIDE